MLRQLSHAEKILVKIRNIKHINDASIGPIIYFDGDVPLFHDRIFYIIPDTK